MTKVEKCRIRRYEERDIPKIVEICSREVPKLPNYEGVVVDHDHLTFTLRHNITNDGYFNAWMLVNSKDEIVGGSCAYCAKLLFSKDLSAGDIFLFVFPEYRTLPHAVGLIKVYKDWAIARNAKFISVTHRGGYEPELMDTLIQRQGFKRVGALYQLRRD